MLEIKNVNVYIKKRQILHDISFSLSSGEILMILGPNGCGKTTLIRAIMNSIEYSGQVFLDNEDIRGVSAKQLAKRIGVLTQNNYMQFDFSCYDLVSMGRYAHKSGMSVYLDEADKKVVDWAFELTKTQDLKHRIVTSLSGGELQRVCLARTFAQEPDILILDEPTNHLDIEHQILIFDIIKDWVSKEGRAVLSIIHDLNMAYTYGTHAFLMSEGREVAYGTPKEVLSKENLETVYNVDLVSWMQSLLSKWK